MFAKNAPHQLHNAHKLFEEHSVENPVCVVKSVTTRNGKIVSKSDCFKGEDTPTCSRTCRSARVELRGKNILPSCGLYNGSMGVVRDIVFQEGHSPNAGDFPLYVLVEFAQYEGEPFDDTNTKLVPITPVEYQCKKKCCKKKFLPLQLCYAKTVHTFQGQNAGPVQPGQPQNAIQRIICDPGDKEFEGRNPGLFYTILSRATTMGKPGEKMSSVIYFTDNMNPARVLDITRGAQN